MVISIIERLTHLELTLVSVWKDDPNTGNITEFECYMNDSQLDSVSCL